MNAPLYVTPTPLPGGVPASNAETADLLRQLLEVQREQVGILRQQQAAADNLARWRAFLQRWNQEFPEVGPEVKAAMPTLERAYLTLIRDVLDRLKDVGEDLGDDFVLTEFLDRYGVKLSQLGNMISNLSPIADAAPADAPAAPQ